MKLEELVLAKSAITDNVYVGKVSKDGRTWLSKKDVTNDFLRIVLSRWAGFEETIAGSDGKQYIISVKEDIKKSRKWACDVCGEEYNNIFPNYCECGADLSESIIEIN